MHSPHSLPTNFTQPRGKCLTPSSEHSLLNQPPIIQFGRQLKPGRAFHTASPTPLPLGGCSTSSPHCTWPRSCVTPWERPLPAPRLASIQAQHRSPGRLILNHNPHLNSSSISWQLAASRQICPLSSSKTRAKQLPFFLSLFKSIARPHGPSQRSGEQETTPHGSLAACHSSPATR